LSVAAQTSGGLLNIVNANELKREIRTAAQRRVIAKDVTVTLHAPGNWCFSPDPRSGVSINGRQLKYTMAQVNDDTNLGFAFGLKDGSEKGGWTKDTVPFQAHITYTSPITGDTTVRILNRVMPTTDDRNHAESGVQVALMGMYAFQRVAVQANAILLEGAVAWNGNKKQIAGLRDYLFAVNKLLIRGAKTDPQQEELGNFTNESLTLDRELETLAKSSAFPYGLSRDNSVKLFARLADISRNTLLAGSKKVGQVVRYQQLR
jgi:hypothetical protein